MFVFIIVKKECGMSIPQAVGGAVEEPTREVV